MTVDLSACLSGQPTAWRDFVRRYGPVIAAAVRHVLGRRSTGHDIDPLVEDVTQEVFVRLVARDYALLRAYDARRAALATWLTVIARSTTLDELRKRRLPTTPLERAADVADTHPTPVVDPAPAPAASPPTDPPATHLVPSDLLSPRQMLVLQLLFDRQMEVAQVAQLLGIDAQSVRSTRHKALEKLRAHFGDAPPT